MKQFKKVVLVTIIFSLIAKSVVFANMPSWESVSINNGGSELLSEEQLSSQDIVYGVARGEILSSAMLEITNEQNGDIFISIDTYAHKSVDAIYHTVFLDQWDESEEDWVQVGYWNFSRTKEEEDGNLTFWITTLTLSGYETGKYYRARGLHGVELNDEIEAKATETDGVLITNGPT